MTAMFIVAADGSFVFEPNVIWISSVFRSSKIRQGQCLFIIFQIAKHGRIYHGDRLGSLAD